MVVGSGMIANAFLQYPVDNTVIFASGVSNSQETNPSEFDREFDLLKQFVGSNNHLVYFGTTSVYDKTLSSTPYVKHKKLVEDYIKLNFGSYNIFRLPIVVGNTNNGSTLIKFLYTKMIQGETVNVYMKACRSILDVEDLVLIVGKVLDHNMFKNDILDIYLSPNVQVTDIISTLENCLGIESNKILLDEGSCYEIDDSKLKGFLDQIGYQTEDNYIFKTINKYYKKESCNQ